MTYKMYPDGVTEMWTLYIESFTEGIACRTGFLRRPEISTVKKGHNSLEIGATEESGPEQTENHAGIK